MVWRNSSSFYRFYPYLNIIKTKNETFLKFNRQLDWFQTFIHRNLKSRKCCRAIEILVLTNSTEALSNCNFKLYIHSTTCIALRNVYHLTVSLFITLNFYHDLHHKCVHLYCCRVCVCVKMTCVHNVTVCCTKSVWQLSVLPPETDRQRRLAADPTTQSCAILPESCCCFRICTG